MAIINLFATYNFKFYCSRSQGYTGKVSFDFNKITFLTCVRLMLQLSLAPLEIQATHNLQETTFTCGVAEAIQA